MSSPWQSSGPDPVIARLTEAPPPEIRSRPSPLRDPARALIALGSVMAIVTSPLPWLTRIGNPPPEVRTGWTGTADGFLLAVVGAVLLILALSRTAAGARSRSLRVLPAGLGALAGVLAVGAQRTMENQVSIWQGEGATGVYEPWFFISLVGAALACIGGLWLGIRRGLEPVAPGDPTDTVRVTKRGMAAVALGGLGTILGAAVVATVVLTSGLNDVAMSMPLLFGVLIGALFGGYVGNRFARLLFVDRTGLERPRDEGVRLEKVGAATVVSGRDRRDEPIDPVDPDDGDPDA